VDHLTDARFLVTETIRPRILVVDDDEPIRMLEKHLFEDAGYEVELAGDGRSALEMIAARPPDLVTLDLVMPDLDGWAVLERLRRMPSAPPVVVVSGRTDEVPPGPPGMLDKCVAAYVTKPFHVVELITACRRVLEAQAVPDPDRPADRRREGRRRFIVEATVMSVDGVPLAMGTVTELSTGGVQLDLAAPLRPGSDVRVVFRLPGRTDPLNVRGRIQWRNGFALGLALDAVPDESSAALKDLIDPAGD
jgi:DNA-binding response OmpR family regulator